MGRYVLFMRRIKLSGFPINRTNSIRLYGGGTRSYYAGGYYRRFDHFFLLIFRIYENIRFYL